MEPKARRIISWAEGQPTGPEVIELNITNICNLKCISCWQRAAQGFDHKRELSDARLLELVDEAQALGVSEVRLPGSGEPFTRRSVIMPLIRRIKAAGMRGLIITNGTLLTESILAELATLQWDNLTISIESPRHLIHDKMRGKWGTLWKIKQALKHLTQIKNQMHTETPLLRFNTVLTKLNYRSLPDLILYAASVGCKNISVQPMTVFSPLGEKIKIDGQGRKLMQPFLKEAVKRAAQLEIITNIAPFIDGELVEKSNRMDEVIKERIEQDEQSDSTNPFLSAPCYEPFYNLIILPEGQTGPCSVFGGVGGENCKEKSLMAVWQGEFFTNMRNALLKKQLASFCSQCCVPVFIENERFRSELKRHWQKREVERDGTI